jgi:hypothetical protein
VDHNVCGWVLFRWKDDKDKIRNNESERMGKGYEVDASPSIRP